MSKRVVIVGGHGQVALRLTKLLTSKNNNVTSIIRNPAHSTDIEAAGAKPVVLSLEEGTVDEFTKVFEGAEVVVWCAGAGGKGGAERTKAVDYLGAIKVYDAISQIQLPTKPRLILISAIDVRDHSKPYPSHYNDSDKAVSDKYGKMLKTYIECKYAADRELSNKRGKGDFEWTIVRPGGLSDEPGCGKVDMGRTHLTPTISRDDLAMVLSILVDRPDAAGFAIDMVGGDTPIEEAIDAFIKKGETDFPDDY